MCLSRQPLSRCFLCAPTSLDIAEFTRGRAGCERGEGGRSAEVRTIGKVEWLCVVPTTWRTMTRASKNTAKQRAAGRKAAKVHAPARVILPVEELARFSIKASSQATYEPNLRMFDAHGFPRTAAGISEFLASDTSLAAPTLRGIVAALKAHLTKVGAAALEEVLPWGVRTDALFSKLIAARANLFTDMSAVRGSLGGERLEQLLAWYRRQPDFRQCAADALTLLHGAGLRFHQLESLCNKSVVDKRADSEYKSWCFCVPRKSPKPDSARELHAVRASAMAAVNRRKAEARSDSEAWFQGKVTEKALSDISERAADALGWEKGVNFHGTHIARRGAARDGIAEGGVSEAKRTTAHHSTTTLLRAYAPSNEQRAQQQHDKEQRAQANPMWDALPPATKAAVKRVQATKCAKADLTAKRRAARLAQRPSTKTAATAGRAHRSAKKAKRDGGDTSAKVLAACTQLPARRGQRTARGQVRP